MDYLAKKKNFILKNYRDLLLNKFLILLRDK